MSNWEGSAPVPYLSGETYLLAIPWVSNLCAKFKLVRVSTSLLTGKSLRESSLTCLNIFCKTGFKSFAPCSLILSIASNC